ncbi:MAG: cytochrome c oxidase subunit 4 [Agromyces sp.]
MKTNFVMFALLSVFFAIFAVIYPTWNYFGDGRIEWVGNIGIALTMIMFALLGSFLYINIRRQGGTLPEDSLVADVDDGDTDMGYYLPWSWWPFFAGAAGGVLMLSMSVGVWLALFSVGLVLITFVGWFFEPFRNQYRR